MTSDMNLASNGGTENGAFGESNGVRSRERT